MYVFVRKDLSKPQQTVQAAHAAIESTKRWPYIDNHPRLVVLGVKSEENLKKILDDIKSQGIMVVDFVEENGETTAFATRPIIDPEERKIFKKYQLLK